MANRLGVIRIPSLDGLRGVSITLVLLSHWAWSYTDGGGAATALRDNLGHLARIGVSVFFVISGFLITRLMLAEKEQTGQINLRDFYIRRALRILPPAYAYLAFLSVLTAVGVLEIPWRDLGTAGLFSADYRYTGQWLLHFWSLSVEEKFYLVWPAVLVCAGIRRARPVLIAVIIASPGIRMLTYWFARDSLRNLGMFHMRMDNLAWGCLLALAWGTVASASARTVTIRGRAGLFVLCLAEPYLQTRFAGAYMLPIGYSLEAVSITAVVAWAVLQRPAVLNRGALPWLGRISFSLYLWQEVFLAPVNHSWIGRAPWNLAFAVLAGWLGYLLIEKPSWRLRQLFTGERKSLAELTART